MAANIPADDQVVHEITVPLSLKREQPRVTHFHEVRAKDAKHLAAILVLANAVIEQLGVENATDLTVTITAVKTEPGLVVTPALEDEPKPDAPTDALAEDAPAAESSVRPERRATKKA